MEKRVMDLQINSENGRKRADICGKGGQVVVNVGIIDLRTEGQQCEEP